ncbi:tyrosine-type recombinase/integrase [Chamaesiphon polymorphus]|uniref:Transposase n=1 Tax=Chamaesiphon polymorphus CCALA 037 TaxID=2107692 RepID=A0A2T1G8L9_9CYAN|nr:site-specific integrase [Chamaesiphon polymorphus]PSB53599.1 transposase [Chamaesiphon polymorphus CCALA 037]
MSTLFNKHPYLEEGFVSVNESAQKLLNNPLIAKDIWRTVEDLGLTLNQHEKTLTISFELIRQDWLRLLAKLYVLVRSKRKLSASYIRSDVAKLNRFSQFIENRSILSSIHINDQLFDEYDYYLHSLTISERSVSLNYMTLINFFNICREEGWLEVNTYWFKGRYKTSTVKRDEIEYIPEEVWQQLNEHLHYLPEPLQRMVLIIRGTGLRIGELLNLPLDCLRQRGNQWRLRFLTEKYQTVDELPICEELVVVIKEQQEYIRQCFGDSYNNLCNSNDGSHHYIPAPRVMRSIAFNHWLNKLSQSQNICTKEGEIWHFKSHQFRKTLATVMTNAGVRDLIIQKYLRHRSPEMQEYYKRLLKKVIGEEYRELMKNSSYVDSTGKMVAQHQPQNSITEVVRRKMYQITTQYGECHRPVLKSPCQTVNACWQCEHWLTSTENLSVLKNDLQRVETEIEIASKLGMVRQQQGLTIDQRRLVIRIEGLEKIDARD